jgi:hypothetical protein
MTRPDFSPDKWNKLIFLREKQGEETSLIYSSSSPRETARRADNQAARPPGTPANRTAVFPGSAQASRFSKST